MAPVGLLLLRMAIGIVLFAHGAHWLFGAFSGAGMGPGGLTATTAYFAATSIGPAFLFVLISGILQFVGGLFLCAGLFTRITANVLTVVALVKLSFDSARWGFFLNWTLESGRGHGMEYALLSISVLICLALSGAGDWSLDGLRTRRNAYRVAGLARIRERG